MFSIRLDTVQTSTDASMSSVSLDEALESDEKSSTLLGLLAKACDELAKSEKFSFVISGFGQPRWPVDVRTDLLTFLEQLQDFLSWLNSATLYPTEFELDFFEQGVERILTFHKTQMAIEVMCISHTAWQPWPEVETTKLADLVGDLIALIQTLRFAVEDCCPHLYGEELLSQWFSELI